MVSAEILLDLDELAADRPAMGVVLPICREIRRRMLHPFRLYKPDDHPDRNQLAFHQSDAPIRFIEGGNQSGKSRAEAQEIAWWLTEKHPYLEIPQAPKIYVISASYRTIQEGVWRHLKACLPEWLIESEGPFIPGWKMPSFIRTKSGGQVDFLSGEGREDARRKIQAAALDLAAVDEEIDEVLWGEITARRLARGGKAIIAATLWRSEPWCLELEDRAEMGDPTIFLVRLDTEVAAQRGHVSKKILKEMKAAFSEEDYLVRVKGRSRKHQGLVYPGFDPKVHLIDPFEIPKEWTRYMVMDPGWRTCAILWAAVAPDGKYVLYRELYYHGADYKEVSNAVHNAEGWLWNEEHQVWTPLDDLTEKIKTRWIDPSAFGHHESGQPKIAQLLNKPPYNLSFVPALNDVNSGIQQCALALLMGIDGMPKMRVFKTCQNFIKEIRKYRWAKDTTSANRAEAPDKPIKREDHLMDAWRYLELGGLRWYDSWEVKENPPIFNVPGSMQACMEKRWKRLRKEEKNPECPPHPGGIGSEY